MNRKNIVRVLGIMMTVPMLAGCGKIRTNPASESPVEETETDESVEVTEGTENVPSENIETTEATEVTEAPEDELPDTEADFKAFLEGSAKATTAESLKKDYERENEQDTYGGLSYGEYTLEELRRAVAKNQATEAAVKYTMLDCNHDGIDELFVRFEALNSSFLSWTGVIRDTEDGLQICSSYEDGYRSYAALYKSGYHTYGGSYSAGAHGEGIYGYREDCSEYCLFTVDNVFATYGADVAYSQIEDQDEAYKLYMTYFSMLEEASGFEMRIYTSKDPDNENPLCISVENYDEGALKEKEEAFLEEVKKNGCRIIESSEMDELSDTSMYCTEEAEWTLLDSGEELVDFTLTVYSDENADDYKALGDAVIIDGSDEVPGWTADQLSNMRFTVDKPGVYVTLQYGSYDEDSPSGFALDGSVFTEECEPGKVYQFKAFEGETFPYFRLYANKADRYAEWFALPDMKDGETTFTVRSKNIDEY